MRTLRRLSLAAALLAAFVLCATLLASLWLGAQAKRAQRVLPHDAATAALLDEVGVPVGKVSRYLIFDEAAFLEGATPDGTRLIDERYLLENGIYPWQLKTVTFARNLVLGICGTVLILLCILLCGVGWWLGRRRSIKLARAQPRS